MANRLKVSLLLILAIGLFDQLTKYIVFLFKFNFEVFPFLSIQLIKNTGSAFGVLKNSNRILLFLGILLLGWGLLKHESLLKGRDWWAYVMVGGGILGNSLDRLFHGFVIDYINFSLWPAFNVADSALTIGIGALLLYALLQKS